MSNRIKILMIALQHSAKDDRIFYKESKSLFKDGYEVSYLILTDINGFMKDMSGNILNPNKEKIIIIDNIKIIGIKPPSDYLNSFLKKIFLGTFQQSFVNEIIKEKADIYHAHEPISLRFAFKASKITNKKIIFDSHESWKNSALKEKIIKLFYIKKIEYLITVNSGILKCLSQKAKPTHSVVIQNTSLIELFPEKYETNSINSPAQLVHEGSLSFNRGLKILLNSILKLKKQYPTINLKILGDSPKKERKFISKFISKHCLQKNITLIGWVNYEDVSKHLHNCDIGLILYTPTKNNLHSTSNKLFNYIASGLSIISLEYLEETNKILKPLNNSLILKNHTSHELSLKINELIKNPTSLLKMKNNSRLAYKNYNWQNEEKKLINFYKKVLND